MTAIQQKVSSERTQRTHESTFGERDIDLRVTGHVLDGLQAWPLAAQLELRIDRNCQPKLIIRKARADQPDVVQVVMLPADVARSFADTLESFCLAPEESA